MVSKNKTTELITDPESVDLDNYYSSAFNREHPGCSLTYKIRNFSGYPIRVRSRFGYCQIIESCKESGKGYGDYQCEKDSVWIDIEFTTKNPIESCSVAIGQSNKIDKAIHERLNYCLYHATDRYRNGFGIGSATCNFGVRLNSTKGNLTHKSYFSETLGIIIDLNTSEMTRTYLDASFVAQNPSPSIIDFDLGNSSYEIIHFVDNTKEFNSLWTMRNGKPSKIKSIVNDNKPSGLYIYNDDSYANNVPYIYIPLYEINDDKLREYGLSYTEKELTNTVRTKEYVDTVKDYEQRLADLAKSHERQIAELIKSHEKQITELKKTHDKELSNKKEEYNTKEKGYEKQIAEIRRNNSENEKVLQKEIKSLNTINNELKGEIKENNKLLATLDSKNEEISKLKKQLLQSDTKYFRQSLEKMQTFIIGMKLFATIIKT